MLLGLRHPAIVSGDHQEGQVNRAHARDHVLHEVFMARHVDDPQKKRRWRGRRRRKFEVGKAKIDGDAARFLFRKTIGVGACQCFD